MHVLNNIETDIEQNELAILIAESIIMHTEYYVPFYGINHYFKKYNGDNPFVTPNPYLFYHFGEFVHYHNMHQTLKRFTFKGGGEDPKTEPLFQSHFIYWALHTMENVHDTNIERYQIFEDKLTEHFLNLYGNPMRFPTDESTGSTFEYRRQLYTETNMNLLCMNWNAFEIILQIRRGAIKVTTPGLRNIYETHFRQAITDWDSVPAEPKQYYRYISIIDAFRISKKEMAIMGLGSGFLDFREPLPEYFDNPF